MNNETTVRFRYGTPVTVDYPFYPEIIPGSLVFDSATLALYIDTDDRRQQIKDPLKLSLTGGVLTGEVCIIEDGAVRAKFTTSGLIMGDFLETKGNIALDNPPDLYAVIDENGRIRTRTKEQMVYDLHIIDPDTLGALAYKNSVTGKYTPVGTVSAPIVTVNYDSESVVKDINAGDLPNYQVSGEKLILTRGTQTTSDKTNVMKSITSVDVTQPVFTGQEGTITAE